MNAVVTLEKFGESYQSKVIAALLSDLPFLNQVSEITNKDYFESEQDKWIVESILDYQAKCKAEADAKIAEAQAKTAAKAALLERLGITEDEAKLLLA